MAYLGIATAFEGEGSRNQKDSSWGQELRSVGSERESEIVGVAGKCEETRLGERSALQQTFGGKGFLRERKLLLAQQQQTPTQSTFDVCHLSPAARRHSIIRKLAHTPSSN